MQPAETFGTVANSAMHPRTIAASSVAPISLLISGPPVVRPRVLREDRMPRFRESSRPDVQLRALALELLRLVAQAVLDGRMLLPLPHPVLRRVVPDLLRDLHGAELRPAHRAEVRDLGALRGKRLIVVRLGG